MRRIYFLLVALALALGPLQWITLANVGPLVLKPVHLPFFAAAALGWVALARGRVLARVVQPTLIFAVPYTIYLVFMLASVALNDGQFSAVAKYTVYFIGICGWFLVLATMDRRDVLAAAFWGSVCAAFLFFVVAFVTLQSRGINLFTVIERAILTGDSTALQFAIFRNLFNESGAVSDEAFGAALRHTSLGFIFIAFVVSLACWNRNATAKAGVILCLFIILISVSRSQWIAALLAVAPLIVRTALSQPVLSFHSVLVALLAVGLLALSLDMSGIETIFEQRLGNLEEDGRVGMFASTFDYIDARPVFGYGAGYEIDFGSGKMLEVHNLFLAAWIQIGLLGLLTAIAFTAALAWIYWNSLVSSFWSYERTCLTGLVILPLFRSQLSGGGGNYTLPEWICIALFLALALPQSAEVRQQALRAPSRDVFS